MWKLKEKKKDVCMWGAIQVYFKHVCNKHGQLFFFFVVVMRSFYLLLIKWFFFLVLLLYFNMWIVFAFFFFFFVFFLLAVFLFLKDLYGQISLGSKSQIILFRCLWSENSMVFHSPYVCLCLLHQSSPSEYDISGRYIICK